LLYVDSVIKKKLLESEILIKQASSNTKGQFAGSPDLGSEVESAIMDASRGGFLTPSGCCYG